MKRMRRCLMLLSFLVVVTSVSAQFNMGVKVGYVSDLGFNQSWALSNGKMNFDADPAQGFDIGVMMRIGRRLFVQPEVLYNWQTYKYIYSLAGTDVETDKLRVNSLDIPVLIGFKIIKTKVVNLSAMVGPKFRINMENNHNITDGTSFVSELRKSQVGLDVGLALDIMHFTVDARYNLMQGVNRYNTVEGDELSSPLSNSFVISLGWFFLNF